MKKVKFIADFGVKRIGDVCQYDGSLASQLVNVDKVAEYTEDDVTEVEEGREYVEPTISVVEDEAVIAENPRRKATETATSPDKIIVEDDVTEVEEETAPEVIAEETPAAVEKPVKPKK